MRMNLKDYVRKYQPYKKLIIKDIEQVKGEPVKVFLLRLVVPIPKVTGSILFSGYPMIKTDIRELYVTEEHLGGIEWIYKKNRLVYAKTRLFLDISKPHVRQIEGKFQELKPAKVWLTGTLFIDFAKKHDYKQ